MEDKETTATPSTTSSNTAVLLPKKKESFFLEILRFTLIALVVVIPIRLFIAQPFIVQGASMEPTFATGEYLIVDQVTYRFEMPARGDVVVFRYPKDPSKFFIKRIIGLPGERVEIDRNVVTIHNAEHPEGFALNEPYIHEMRPDTVLTESLNEHEYFVMGDNRNASSDSRVWGALPTDHIIGRAIIRLLPVTAIDVLPGKSTPQEEPLTE